MITYKEIDYSEVAVYLEGKRVGTIVPIHGGLWQYWPKGPRAEGGEKFLTLALCKKSLEAED